MSGPGKPGQPRTGLPAKASHTSLSQEPGFNLFLVIFHELTLSQVHLEFSQLQPESGRGQVAGMTRNWEDWMDAQSGVSLRAVALSG